MAEEKKVFKVDFTEPLVTKFTISKTVTPEELAELILFLAYVYKGDSYAKEFEKNGHENAVERFEKKFKDLVTQVSTEALNKVLQSVSDKIARDEPAVSPLDGIDYAKRISSGNSIIGG